MEWLKNVQSQTNFQTDHNLEISEHKSHLDTGNQAIQKFNIHKDSCSIEKQQRHNTSMLKNSGNKIITDSKHHSSQKKNAEQTKVTNKFEKNELVKHNKFFLVQFN